MLIILFVLLVDVIMDMLGNSQWREAILQYYENSGDPKAVFEVIKMSQEKKEETTDRGNDGFNYMLFGKKRCACVCMWDTTLSICRMCLCNKAFTLFAN